MSGQQDRPKKLLADILRDDDNGHRGERLLVRDLATAGVQFVVTDITERVGKFGEFLLVGIEVNGEPAHFLSSHRAVVQKLRKAVDALPLLATIRERRSRAGRNYFDIG